MSNLLLCAYVHVVYAAGGHGIHRPVGKTQKQPSGYGAEYKAKVGLSNSYGQPKHLRIPFAGITLNINRQLNG